MMIDDDLLAAAGKWNAVTRSNNVKSLQHNWRRCVRVIDGNDKVSACMNVSMPCLFIRRITMSS